MSKVTILLLVVGFSALSSACTQPELNLYQSTGYSDDYIEKAKTFNTRENIPDLEATGLDNSRLHHCESGVWIGYDETNYGGSAHLLAREEGECVSTETYITYRSFQVVGSPSNFTTPSLNFFETGGYAGPQVSHFENVPVLNQPFNSLVLLGDSDVELFVGERYQGLSICIRPHLWNVGSYFDLINNKEWAKGTYLHYAETTLGLSPSTIKSFRFGCSPRARNFGKDKKHVRSPLLSAFIGSIPKTA